MTGQFWQDKRVLITGCTGFLGSWLTAKLVDSGAEVVGLVRDSVPNSELIRSGTVESISTVAGDVSDYELLERTLAEYEIELVFHLAAQTIVGIANRAPLSTFETNIKGTWVLLEAARRVSTIQGVIVASSDRAYANHSELPCREESPLGGRHPYDVSKSCADLITQTYGVTFGLPVAVTRFVNLYGGGDLNWNRIVPGTIRKVLRAERPIIRSDGTFERDYLYVQDAVHAYMLIAERIQDPAVCGQAFNFGVDRPISVRQMVETIISLSDYPDLEPIVLDQARNEIADQHLSSIKARELLGWQPEFDLADGLAKSIDWYRKFLAEA